MKIPARIAERGLLSDAIIRWGIRRLHEKALPQESGRDVEAQGAALRRFIDGMRSSPTGLDTQLANAQHYEAPSGYFRLFLGPRMK